MQQRHSDIFEEYARIALEKGLISNAAEEDDDSDSKKEKSSKEDKPSKEDKKELSTAEIFYGVKTTPTKELLEQAHPKTIVMGPSYDKFNGVVENLQQRQDMMAHIALKNPQILQSNTRYIKAHQDLINETIKIAHFLDNQNQESLMKLADSCTDQLTKEAGVPGGFKTKLLGLLGLGGAALIASAIAAQYFPASQDFKSDLAALQEKLAQVIGDYPQTGELLSAYLKNIDAMTQDVSYLDAALAKITSKSISAESVVDKNKQAMARHNLAKSIFHTKLYDEVANKIEDTKSLLDNFISSSPRVASALDKMLTRERASSGTFTRWLSGIGRTVLLSDTEDAIKLIAGMLENAKTYKDQLNESLKDIEKYRKYLDKPVFVSKTESKPSKEIEESKDSSGPEKDPADEFAKNVDEILK